MTLTSINITGSSQVGGLAGAVIGNNQNILSNIHIFQSSIYASAIPSGSPATDSAHVGGLLGLVVNTKLSLENSSSEARVESGKNYIGGFVGGINASQVNLQNLTYSGILRGGIRMGGIFGLGQNASTNITLNSIHINQADIQGANEVGGVIGDVWNNLSITGSNILVQGNISSSGSNGGSIFGRINLTPTNQIFSGWTGNIQLTNIIDEVTPFKNYIGNSSHYKTPDQNDRTQPGQISIP
jgi:hypothetical protein